MRYGNNPNYISNHFVHETIRKTGQQVTAGGKRKTSKGIRD